MPYVENWLSEAEALDRSHWTGVSVLGFRVTRFSPVIGLWYFRGPSWVGYQKGGMNRSLWFFHAQISEESGLSFLIFACLEYVDSLSPDNCVGGFSVKDCGMKWLHWAGKKSLKTQIWFCIILLRPVHCVAQKRKIHCTLDFMNIDSF